jgi:hypothetical protein
MPTIPGQHERDLSEFSQKHSTIVCRIGIVQNAGLRTTPSGDIQVDANRHREATRKRIEADLEEYVSMARALAGIAKA